MSSVRQIANELGISVATVSRAINQHAGVSEETRKKVLMAADRYSYRPTTGRKPTNVIGLVYPEEPVKSDLGDFEAALLVEVQAIERAPPSMRAFEEGRLELYRLGRAWIDPEWR